MVILLGGFLSLVFVSDCGYLFATSCNAVYQSNVVGTEYAAVVFCRGLQEHDLWNPRGGEAPTLAPHEAEAVARRVLQSRFGVLSERFHLSPEEGLMSISLRRCPAGNGFYYVVAYYWAFGGDTLAGRSRVEIPVLMSGRPVEPRPCEELEGQAKERPSPTPRLDDVGDSR